MMLTVGFLTGFAVLSLSVLSHPSTVVYSMPSGVGGPGIVYPSALALQVLRSAGRGVFTSWRSEGAFRRYYSSCQP